MMIAVKMFTHTYMNINTVLLIMLSLSYRATTRCCGGDGEGGLLGLESC